MCWLLQNCWEWQEASRFVVLPEATSVATLWKATGALSVSNYPAEPAPYMLLHKLLICRSVLCCHSCTPRAKTQPQWCGWQEVSWKILGEVKWFLCASAALSAFVQGVSTWILNVFLFIYNQQQDLLRRYFSFPIEAGMQILFSPPSPILTLCCSVYLQKKFLMENRIMTNWPSLHLLHLHGAVTCQVQD